jgi:ParB-like chromosome segregation protein Spo0J
MGAAASLREFTPHPAAELFPLLDKDELRALADDIAKNGLLEPIVTWQGQILDGRNRLAACSLAGVAPTYVMLKRLPGGDAVAYALSKNLKRRHLTAPQRAVLAVQAAELMAGEAVERKREGGKSGGKVAGKGRPKAEGLKVPKPKASKTAARAAKASGAGEKQVQAMAAVKKAAPEVFKAVQLGEVKTVADAKRLAAVEDPKERGAALQLVKSGAPAQRAIDTVSAPTPAGTPTPEQRMKTIERLMNESRPLAEKLSHKRRGIVLNARKLGVNNIGGLGGFRVALELTALKTTLKEMDGLFS